MDDTSESRVIPFADTALEIATDQDVLMCYQLLLGRDPENSYVIQEAKTQPLRSLFEAFMQSDEFENRVRLPFRRGELLAHDGETIGPSAEQLVWLNTKLRLTRRVATALAAARSWRKLFVVLFTIPGFTPAAQPAPPQFLGAIDGLVGRQVRGWCINTAEPDRPVTLTILADGEIVGHCECQLPRSDIQTALGGEGHCGFEFDFPDGSRARSFVMTVGGAEGAMVLGPLDLPASESTLTGHAALHSSVSRLDRFAQQLAEVLPSFSAELRQIVEILPTPSSNPGQDGRRIVSLENERLAKAAGLPELHLVPRSVQNG